MQPAARIQKMAMAMAVALANAPTRETQLNSCLHNSRKLYRPDLLQV
jgi:hypothetical protein